MIDVKLLAMLNDIESKGENLWPIATMLNDKKYEDIGTWYEKYTGKNIESDSGYGCAELLAFMFQRDNIDLLPVEYFLPVLDELSSKYGIHAKDVFQFLQDYRKLLLG